MGKKSPEHRLMTRRGFFSVGALGLGGIGHR